MVVGVDCDGFKIHLQHFGREKWDGVECDVEGAEISQTAYLGRQRGYVVVRYEGGRFIVAIRMRSRTYQYLAP